MSMPLVALCADEECFRHPELLGLEGENLLAQQWLMPFTSAEAARMALRDAMSVQEVWVVSCADVAPINLAAALKRDRADRRVCMLTAQESGSLRSRTTAAGVDASLTRQAFVERYAQCKQAAMRAIELQAGVGPGAGCAPAGEAARSLSGRSRDRRAPRPRDQGPVLRCLRRAGDAPGPLCRSP